MTDKAPIHFFEDGSVELSDFLIFHNKPYHIYAEAKIEGTTKNVRAVTACPKWWQIRHWVRIARLIKHYTGG